MMFLVLFLYLTLSFGFIELAHPNEEQPSYIPPIKTGRKRRAHSMVMVKKVAFLSKILYFFDTDVSFYREKDLNILPVLIEVTKVVFHFSKTELL